MSTTIKQTYQLGEHDYTHEQLAQLAVAVACTKKATHPLILDLRHLSAAFTEIFTIVSAANTRQVYAISEEVRLFFKKAFGLNPIAIDGVETRTWILMDYGFMFVHIFQEPTREIYQLEQLWSKARNISATEDIFHPLYAQALASLKEDDSLVTTDAPDVGSV